ncbi:pyruvate dehydrogenase protein x component [Pseudovirgaria hyperparasitica]|uniref:Pyruvate dehydrogenase protein x component n=1 Tax=Pseudovirgaria hyperparasitica TaxID=470096 RepID=A0A6A6W477_9PEZI|nr:pyruvate dehydrogenase protein x component [Pseudovirgaria hyperparasitica]KAF2756367.1 pyruvate dehydrogenase protein x component [Pseudovirgaria hyperparasitica]
MTEGNISSWKVKEGDSFSTGDILLEIETDKAQMEVEATDDGVMAKITQGDGSKGVKVGARIAVLADPDEDLSSLEIPAEDTPKISQPGKSEKPTQQESAPAKESQPQEAERKTEVGNMPSSAGEPKQQSYPLYPSVQFLLHSNGLSNSEASKIPATGPNGRILKGDVLAYLGRIEKSYSAEQSKRIAKLGHLDLSNIKLAAPHAQKDIKPTTKEVQPVPEPPVELSLPISLTAVLATQSRLEKTLGIHLPTSTFVARAIDLANSDLPNSPNRKPTANDLFNSVLGLDSLSPRTTYGHFNPQITPYALKSAGAPAQPVPMHKRKTDIFDEILGSKPKTRNLPAPATARPVKEAVNVFTVSASRGDEKRAMIFLERVKTALEAEPGTLVL